MIDAPLDCLIVSRRPAPPTIESGIEAETGWEHVRLTCAHDLLDGTTATLSYAIAEDSFVTLDLSFESDRERELVLGWGMSDRLRELWYTPRGPLSRERYGLTTFAGKRRYVEIDRARADEFIANEDTRKALSLDLLDGANCHFSMLPRFFDGTESMQVSRDRTVQFRVRAKRYSNTFMLHFYPTTNYNPRRLFTAGTGGGSVREAYDPYRSRHFAASGGNGRPCPSVPSTDGSRVLASVSPKHPTASESRCRTALASH